MVLQRGKRRLVWLALVVIALGAALLAAAIWGLPGRSRGKQELAAEFVANGQASLEQGDVRSAWEQFAQAAELDASRPDYAQRAAAAAAQIDAREAAATWSQRAWQAGLRDAEVLRVMARSALTLEPPPVTSDTLLAMCRELPAGLERDALQAEILDLSGRPREAIAVWTGVLQQRATAEWVEQLAQAYVQAGEPRAALEFLAAPARQELLNEASYSLRLNLQAGQHDWAQARDTCRLAQQTGHYAGPAQLDHALLLAVDGQDDQAVLVLRPLADQTRSTAGPYPLHARLLLSYLHLRTGDRAAIGALLERARSAGTDRWNEAEQQFHEGLLALLDSDVSAEEQRLRNALRRVDLAARGVPDQPIVEWTLGCLHARLKGFDAACEHFQAIAGLWAAAPPVMLAHAQALGQNHEPSRAWWLLDELHRSGTASRASLSLQAELPAEPPREVVRSWAQHELQQGPTRDDSPSDVFSLEISTATPIFRSSQEPYPDTPELQVARIAHWIDQERHEDALLAARSSQAPHAERQRWIASALWRLDRTDEAASAFEAAVQQTQDAAVHAEFGDLLSAGERDDQARAQYQQALAQDPHSAQALIGLATLADRAGDYVACRAHARAALAMDNQQELPYVLLAAADLHLGRFDEGLETCDRALVVAPGSVQAWVLKCLLYQERGEYARAETALLPLLEADPQQLELIRPMVALRQNQQQWAAALPWIERGLALQPLDPELLAQRVLSRLRAGQTAQAHADLDQAQPHLPPETAIALAAELALAASDAAAADRLLLQNLELPGVAARRLELLLERGEGAEARALFDARDWSFDELLRAGRLAMERSQFEQAAACYTRALQLDPDNPTLLNEWAWSRLQTDQQLDAAVLDASRRAHEAHPAQPDFLHTYAEALCAGQQYQACRDLLSQSPATRDHARLGLLLGRSLEAAGDAAAALQQYEACRALLRRDPDQESAAGDLKTQVERRIAAVQAGTN